MEAILIYLFTGAIAGTLAGLLGVGGGLVIVPVLAFHFSQIQLVDEHLMHLAIGTSLATIVFTGLSSVLAHHRRNAVDWGVVRRLSPGLVLGALTGALLADQLSSRSLQGAFGVFELLVAVQLGFNVKPASHAGLPNHSGFLTGGWVIGTVSSIMGIGGGTLTVPFLLWFGVVMRNAVAISAACGLPIALGGAVGFLVSGWGEAGLPEWSTGYIYWPAFLGIAAASILFAPVGARLAHALPGDLLRRVFAVFLVLAGLTMLFG